MPTRTSRLFTAAAMGAAASLFVLPASAADPVAPADPPPAESASTEPAPPPAPAPAPAHAPQPAPIPAPATAPAPPEPIDVTVAGEPRAAMAMSMSRSDVRLMPGAFGEPFRAIESLPGVTPYQSGVPLYYVRGAPPGNVGYLLDGVRLPTLFHLLAGPAVVASSLLDRVELFPGAAPAELGRATAGFVTAHTRPPSPELRAEATIRAIDAAALLEAPLPEGRGAALAAARYSYASPVVGLFAPTLRMEYWDYQARVALDVTPTDRLTLLVLGSHDQQEHRTLTAWQTELGADFHRIDLRHDADLGPRTRLSQAITVGFDETPAAVGPIFQTPGLKSTFVAARSRVAHRFGEGLLARAGVSAELSDFAAPTLLYASDLDLSLFPPRQDVALGAFADAVLTIGGAEITPGARVDFWGSGGVTALSADVRLAARVPVTRGVRFSSAAGLTHQGPGLVYQIPAGGVGRLRGGLQRSVQTSASVEVDLPLEITGSVAVFHSTFFDLSDAMGLADGDYYLRVARGDLTWINERVDGQAYGLEVYLRRKLSKQLGGFLSYTLSRSVRSRDGQVFEARSDRRHVLGAALSWDIGWGFRAGARFTFYTGGPVDPFYPPEAADLLGSDHFDPFFRLDARVEKRWKIGERGFVAVVAEIVNATLAAEQDLRCYTLASTTCQVYPFGPVTLPSIGVEGGL